jgi:hypothetical protein
LRSLSIGNLVAGEVEVCLDGRALSHQATWEDNTVSITFGDRIQLAAGGQLRVNVKA